MAVLFEKETLEFSENLAKQLEACKDLLETAGVFLVSGNQISDMVKSCLMQNSQAKEIVLITADELLLQVASKQVTVQLVSAKAENGHFLKYDSDVIKEKYGVNPEQLLEVFALTGSRMHDIKGAMGIGLHTACELIAEYGTVDKLYEQLETVDRPWKKEALLEGKEQVLCN